MDFLLTDTAVDTFLRHPGNLHATLDAKIVFLCLEAVILASRHAKLEFMRQFLSEIMLIQLLSQRIGIDTAAGTDGRSLTGCNCANSGPADTGLHTPLGKLLPDRLDIVKIDKRNLNSLSGGHMDIAFSVLLCYLSDRFDVLRRQISSNHLQPQRKEALELLPVDASLFE